MQGRSGPDGRRDAGANPPAPPPSAMSRIPTATRRPSGDSRNRSRRRRRGRRGGRGGSPGLRSPSSRSQRIAWSRAGGGAWIALRRRPAGEPGGPIRASGGFLGRLRLAGEPADRAVEDEVVDGDVLLEIGPRPLVDPEVW